LHAEADLGVSLAPSAMDTNSYVLQQEQDTSSTRKLHPDDGALLEWKGSMGDTVADLKHRRQEQAHAMARQWLQAEPTSKNKKYANNNKKAFSRVLKEDMQTWMKKTTYLSNDYSRKVHDFKSLAQTKKELAADLEAKQEVMEEQRTFAAISAQFALPTVQHPTNKKLKPVSVCQMLPNVENWGRAFTHVLIDKAPTHLPKTVTIKDLNAGAFVANVEKRGTNAHMSCQVLAPTQSDKQQDSQDSMCMLLLPVQTLDLDVVPLKEEDAPHMNFCFWVDKAKGVASYLPISSRLQLSTGRPVLRPTAQALARRSLTTTEQRELEERMAEVDRDMADKHHIVARVPQPRAQKQQEDEDASEKEEDDGEGDFGDEDSDSENEGVFGTGGTKTIVADS
jgi:hypothetical protein